MQKGRNMLSQNAYDTLTELLDTAMPADGELVVIGCSTSETVGGDIGHNSSPEAAALLYEGFSRAVSDYAERTGRRVYIVAQCCEHLNRAIVAERESVRDELRLGIYTEVSVVPQPKAGGSFPTEVYAHMKDPVMLEEVRAACGIDVGGTLIGMHLRSVAVPVKLEHRVIGQANVTAARTRPKLIGGERAKYGR